jgi:hypothetical protein
VDWSSRRIAVLALESKLLLLDPGATDEFVPLLARLGFTPEVGAVCRSDVLKQGYTTTEPRAFFGELKWRLSRLAPVHDFLRCGEAAPEAVAKFEHVASQECLLTLARAVFGADEVVSRVLSLVRLTAAEIDTAEGDPHLQQEAKRAIDLLPDYEADILLRFRREVRSWWISSETPGTCNALVESPIGTSALVIRPPGSTVEFEIKRVGMRSRHPLNIVFKRDRSRVAPSHRLQGACTLSVLRWEATNSALLSSLYRKIHGEPAPIAQITELRAIKAVPRSDGDHIRLLNWFEDPAAFGGGFDAMRRAMARSLSAFVEEGYVIKSVPRSPEAQTRAFLQCMTPAQCTLVGTSALRLDKADAWLRGKGAESYFTTIYGRRPSVPQACSLADTILLEILGMYRPPARRDSYPGYVAAAFADAENRAAADRAFSAALKSLGCLWGTLLGLRGFTEGECFVPRNVGLKAVFTGGTWRPQIIFMDHELTSIVGKRWRHFHPRTALPGMHKDWVHIVGGKLGGQLWPGTVATLIDIYRVDAALADQGRASMIEEIRRAYRVTLARLRDDEDVRAHFRPSFLDPLLAWDAVIARYRASRVGARKRSKWKGRMRRVMETHGLDEPLIQEYREAIHRHRRMLHRCPYLFDADDGTQSG